MLQIHNKPHHQLITVLSMAIVVFSLVLLIYQTALLDKTLSRRTDAIEKSIADTKIDAEQDRTRTEHNLEMMKSYVDKQYAILKDLQQKLNSISGRNAR